MTATSERGGVILLGPDALAQDHLEIAIPDRHLGQDQLSELEETFRRATCTPAADRRGLAPGPRRRRAHHGRRLNGTSLKTLATARGVSGRHLRPALDHELGASPRHL